MNATIRPQLDPDRPRYRYQLRFAIAGRIRFLSHLEMVDTMLSALRRSGVRMALSEGMKPKPMIKVAMPRPVGVESWDEVVEVELQEPVDPDQFALELSATLPVGVTLLGIEQLDGRYESAPSRVAGAMFRVCISGTDRQQLQAAVDAYHERDAVLVERRSPKKTRTVDVRAVVPQIALLDTDDGDATMVRFHARLTAEGSAKPEEVVRALASLSAAPLHTRRVIRESITLSKTGDDGVVAEPALVGADVPEGPQKPWGAC
jgi:radical SAM-linked protein